MGWLLKRQCLPFNAANRCVLIGRIYLSLVACKQVTLRPTNHCRLTILGLMLEGFGSGCWWAWFPTPTRPLGEGTHTGLEHLKA